LQTDDFLELGKRMLVTSESPTVKYAEGLRRTGISRIYYHIYHVALSYATAPGPGAYQPNPNEQSHKSLWKWFEDRGHRDVKHEARKYLNKRVAADYHPYDTFSADAQTWIKLAEDTIFLIQSKF
jgi:hypothetical protein